MGNINLLLEKFESISLDEMSAVSLQSRFDTKFVFKFDNFNLLDAASENYKILEINGIRYGNYESRYFDNENLNLYFAHHNGYLNKFKIRYRKYIDSNLCFLEVKKKVKGKTIKQRIQVSDFENTLSDNAKDFIYNTTHLPKDNYRLSLTGKYRRITLVNKDMNERLTIDYKLEFNYQNTTVAIDDLVIAEIKQARINRLSPFYRLLRENRIHPLRISKYCVGIVLTRQDFKHNNFKKKFLALQKISSNDTIRNIISQ